MAVALRATSTNSSTTSVAPSIAKPTGVQAGDLILISMTSSSSTLSLTNFGSNATTMGTSTVYLFSKIADGSESSTLTFSGGTGTFAATAAAYSGVNQTNPMGTVNQVTGTGTSFAIPAIASTANGSKLFVGTHHANSNAMTAPTGYTREATIAQGTVQRVSIIDTTGTVNAGSNSATGNITATGSVAYVLLAGMINADPNSLSVTGIASAQSVPTPTVVTDGTISYRSGSYATPVTGSSLSINVPAGVQSGDLLLAALQQNVTSTAFSNDGSWTDLGTYLDSGGNAYGLIYKFAGSSEPTAYTFTSTNSSYPFNGFMAAYAGVDGTHPVDVYTTTGGSMAALTGNMTVNGVTTAAVNETLLIVGGTEYDRSLPLSSTGFTYRGGSESGSSSVQGCIGLLDKMQAASGASGNFSVNEFDAASHPALFFTVALTPALLPAPTTLTPTRIASAETLGTATVVPGGVTVTPTGIASLEAFGTASLARTGIFLRGDTSATANDPATSITCNLPSGVQSGDLLLAMVENHALSSPAPPSGWTPIGTNQRSSGRLNIAYYYRVAGASEPASYTFPTTTGGIVILAAYAGVDTTNPVNVSGFNSGSGTSATLGNITTTADHCEIVGFLSADDYDAHSATTPSGWLDGITVGNDYEWIAAGLFDEPQATAGTVASATLDWSSTGTTTSWVTATFALAPVAVAAAQTISPTGLASAEAFGTASVRPGDVVLAPVAIASSEAVGTVGVQPGAVAVAPTALGSLETVYLPTLVASYAINSPTAPPSGEAFGTTVLTPSNILAPAGISTGEAFGTARLDRSFSVSGIPSGEAFGSAVLVATQFLSPTSMGSAEAFGTARLDRTLTAPSVASGEAFGSVTVSPGVATITTASVASSESFGTASVTDSAMITPGGVASSEVFGAPSVTIGASSVSPDSVSSDESFGTASILPVAFIAPVGVASAESFGTASVAFQQAVSVAPTAISSAESFGAPVVTAGVVNVSPTGVVSGEQVDAPVITTSSSILARGVDSSESFGSAVVSANYAANPAAISTGELVPGPVVLLNHVFVPAISSAESFGSVIIGFDAELFVNERYVVTADERIRVIEVSDRDLIVEGPARSRVIEASERIFTVEGAARNRVITG